jgi:hypothetical protein
MHQNGNATSGQFAFTTAEAGNYLACFWIDSAEKGSGISLNLDWKIGIARKRKLRCVLSQCTVQSKSRCTLIYSMLLDSDHLQSEFSLFRAWN